MSRARIEYHVDVLRRLALVLVAVWVAMIALPAHAGSGDHARLICAGRGEDLGELSDVEEREVVDCLLYRLDPASTDAQTNCCEGPQCCVEGACTRRSCGEVKLALSYLADVTNVPAQGLDRVVSLRNKRSATYMNWGWARYFIDALTNLGYHANSSQQPALADALAIYLNSGCVSDTDTPGCTTRPLDSAKRLTKLLISKPFAQENFSAKLVALLAGGIDNDLRRQVIKALLELEPSGDTRDEAVDELLTLFKTAWRNDVALRAQAIRAVAQLGWRSGPAEGRSRRLLLQYMDPLRRPRELYQPTVEAVAAGMERYEAEDLELVGALLGLLDDPDLGPIARAGLERIPALDGGRPELFEAMVPLLEGAASSPDTQLLVAGWVWRHGEPARLEPLFSRLSGAEQTNELVRARLIELAAAPPPTPTPVTREPTTPPVTAPNPTPKPPQDRPRDHLQDPGPGEHQDSADPPAPDEAKGLVVRTWRRFSDWLDSDQDTTIKGLLALFLPGLAFGLLLRPLMLLHPISIHYVDRWMYQRLAPDGRLAKLRTSQFLRTRFFEHPKVCRSWVTRAYAAHETSIRDRGGYLEQVPHVFPQLRFSRRKDVVIDSPAKFVAQLFEARSTPRRTVIFGNAHTGKSQLARAVARELLTRRKVIPIYIDVAAQWFETNPLDREQIYALVAEHLHEIDTIKSKMPPEFLRGLIRDGHVVVLLDGVEQRHQQVGALLGSPSDVSAPDHDVDAEASRLPTLLIFTRRNFTDAVRVDRRARLDEVELDSWQKFGVDPASARAQVGESPVPVGVLAGMVANDQSVNWDAYAEALVAPLIDYEQPLARAALLGMVGHRTVKTPVQTVAALDELAKQRGWRALYEPQWALDHSLFDINGEQLCWRIPNFEAYLLTEYLRHELGTEPIDVDVDRTMREWLAAKVPPDPLTRLEAAPLDQTTRDKIAAWREKIEAERAKPTPLATPLAAPLATPLATPVADPE